MELAQVAGLGGGVGIVRTFLLAFFGVQEGVVVVQKDVVVLQEDGVRVKEGVVTVNKGVVAVEDKNKRKCHRDVQSSPDGCRGVERPTVALTSS